MLIRRSQKQCSWFRNGRVYALQYLLKFRNRTLLILTLAIFLISLASFLYLVTRERVLFIKRAEYNYGVVIDAGSSGSRVFLYMWAPHSGNAHELLAINSFKDSDGNPVYKKITPGLSSFANAPERSFEYMKPLLDFVAARIPKPKLKDTPLYILATAGMRLIEKSSQDAILQNLQANINLKYNFRFSSDHTEVISGKQEGVFQWIAINYVLGYFNHTDDSDDVIPLSSASGGNNDSLQNGASGFLKPTVGAIDMGGASLQVAFEIEKDKGTWDDGIKNNVIELNLGCQDSSPSHKHSVYVTTFLGFGANSALDGYRKQLLGLSLNSTSLSSNNSKSAFSLRPIPDPCLPLRMVDTIPAKYALPYLNSSTSDNKTSQLPNSDDLSVTLIGTGNWDACYNKTKQLATNHLRSKRCSGSDCGSDRQNPVKLSLPLFFGMVSELYGFSEFWYSMEDVWRIGGKYNFNSFRKIAKEFCSTDWKTTWFRFKSNLYPRSDVNRIKYQCFKSSWMSTFLHETLGLPQGYSHLTASPTAINGNVVHWTLGALLYKLRYLPLGSIGSVMENGVHHGVRHFPGEQLLYDYGPFIFLICIISVVLYLHRLFKHTQDKPAYHNVVSTSSGDNGYDSIRRNNFWKLC